MKRSNFLRLRSLAGDKWALSIFQDSGRTWVEREETFEVIELTDDKPSTQSPLVDKRDWANIDIGLEFDSEFASVADLLELMLDSRSSTCVWERISVGSGRFLDSDGDSVVEVDFFFRICDLFETRLFGLVVPEPSVNASVSSSSHGFCSISSLLSIQLEVTVIRPRRCPCESTQSFERAGKFEWNIFQRWNSNLWRKQSEIFYFLFFITARCGQKKRPPEENESSHSTNFTDFNTPWKWMQCLHVHTESEHCCFFSTFYFHQLNTNKHHHIKVDTVAFETGII